MLAKQSQVIRVSLVPHNAKGINSMSGEPYRGLQIVRQPTLGPLNGGSHVTIQMLHCPLSLRLHGPTLTLRCLHITCFLFRNIPYRITYFYSHVTRPYVTCRLEETALSLYQKHQRPLPCFPWACYQPITNWD